MKQAAVIHPRFTLYGGAELIALHVIKALQDSDFSVSIVTDNYNPKEIETNFRMGSILEASTPINIPPFNPIIPRFLAFQRLQYSTRVMKILRNLRVDVAFSTQSVLYYVPNVKTCQIVYDVADLFEIMPGGRSRGPLASTWKKPYYKLLRIGLNTDLKKNRLFVPLSHALEEQLTILGYPHSSVVYPPCEMIFTVKSKKKQICLVSRIAPQKNIEDFMNIARELPAYNFILVGAHSDTNPGYTRRVLSIKPSNVEYIEARIVSRPELVEESKVYLYTSLEPGIGIALGQAMGAGCVPVTPAWGGGAEMVLESGVGYTYRTTAEAAQKVKLALESNDKRNNPQNVAQRAKVFSSDNFHQRIVELATGSSS